MEFLPGGGSSVKVLPGKQAVAVHAEQSRIGRLELLRPARKLIQQF